MMNKTNDSMDIFVGCAELKFKILNLNKTKQQRYTKITDLLNVRLDEHGKTHL